MFIAHGVSEHCERYNKLALLLQENQFAVYACDYRTYVYHTLKKLKYDIRTKLQGLKRGLVVSKRLTEAHIWLIVKLIKAIVK